jgi:hypothetical protein
VFTEAIKSISGEVVARDYAFKDIGQHGEYSADRGAFTAVIADVCRPAK